MVNTPLETPYVRSLPSHLPHNVRKQPPNPTVEHDEIEGGHGSPHQRSPDSEPRRASHPGTAYQYYGSVAPGREASKYADETFRFYITPYAIDCGAPSSLGFYTAAILNGGAFFGCYVLRLLADSGLGIFNSVVAVTLTCAVTAFAWIGARSISGTIACAIAYVSRLKRAPRNLFVLYLYVGAATRNDWLLER